MGLVPGGYGPDFGLQSLNHGRPGTGIKAVMRGKRKGYPAGGFGGRGQHVQLGTRARIGPAIEVAAKEGAERAILQKDRRAGRILVGVVVRAEVAAIGKALLQRLVLARPDLAAACERCHPCRSVPELAGLAEFQLLDGPASGMYAREGDYPQGLPLCRQPGPQGGAPVAHRRIQNLPQEHPEWEEMYPSCLQIGVAVSIFLSVASNLRATDFQSASLPEACRQISDRSASNRSPGYDLAMWR